MIRIGAAAAPRWWGVTPARRPEYLDHLSASGATSVELIVHHGPAVRDPASVHLDRREWSVAVAEAAVRGLHVDVHNSLDPRFQLERWERDRSGLVADVSPVLDLLVEIEERQEVAPAFVVHAAANASEPGRVTAEVLRWMADELERRGGAASVCVELRAATDAGDTRLDRDRGRLTTFLDALGHPSIGLCWDVANEWLTTRRLGRSAAGHLGPLPPCLRHVHLHGATVDGLLHAPLGDGEVPWEASIASLRRAAWSGSVTLEIRYRLAHDVGDPWTVLSDSVRRASRVER